MDIYNCKKIIVLKYFEMGTDRDGNRIDYTRYICLPYTRRKSQIIKNYMTDINSLVCHQWGRYVKRKFVTGQENIKQYLGHLKCKVTKLKEVDSEEVREPITAKIYKSCEMLPHEDVPEYDIPHIFRNTFGEHFIGDDKMGVNLRKL